VTGRLFRAGESVDPERVPTALVRRIHPKRPRSCDRRVVEQGSTAQVIGGEGWIGGGQAHPAWA
jgi:hypothetical protein